MALLQLLLLFNLFFGFTSHLLQVRTFAQCYCWPEMPVPVSATDQPCPAITVIYDVLQDVEMSGMCVGGAVISSQECVRA